MKPEEEAAAKKKGDPVHIPTVLRRDHRVLQPARRQERPQARRQDDRRHLPRQGQEVERPRDRRPELGPEAARDEHHRRATAPTRRARRRASPSSSPTTARSGRAAPASTRTSSGRPAPAPRATTASPAAVKQTEGAVGYVEQAYALQNGFTYAAVKNKAGQYIAPTLESTSAAGDGIQIPDDLRINASTRPTRRPTRSPRRPSRSPTRTRARPAWTRTRPPGSRSSSTYLVGDGQATIQKLSYAKIPSALQAKVKIDGMQCNGSAIAG